MNAALLVLLVLAAAAPAVATATQPRPAPSPRAVGLSAEAPVDAYFGPFGMSPLSIRSTIGFLGRQYHYRTIDDHDLLRKALITEDALRKWRTAYPADPWLAPTFYHLEQLYQAVQSQEARKHATAILNDVIRNYPQTKEGHLSRARLAAGFPPLVPESPLAPSPTPSSNDASPAPSNDGTASPTPAATSSPVPAATSSPSR